MSRRESLALVRSIHCCECSSFGGYRVESNVSETAMIFVGGSPQTIQAAAEAIVLVLKAAGTENASIAAVNCLAQLARAPENTRIEGCSFTSQPMPRRKRK
jgi:hypothetical protein